MSVTATFNSNLWIAICEPSRRRIIDALLSKGEATASKLADEVPFSRQAVSKHMVILKSAGLIRERRTGRELRFSIDPKGIAAASKELSTAADMWEARLLSIKQIAEEIYFRDNI